MRGFCVNNHVLIGPWCIAGTVVAFIVPSRASEVSETHGGTRQQDTSQLDAFLRYLEAGGPLGGVLCRKPARTRVQGVPGYVAYESLSNEN